MKIIFFFGNLPLFNIKNIYMGRRSLNVNECNVIVVLNSYYRGKIKKYARITPTNFDLLGSGNNATMGGLILLGGGGGIPTILDKTDYANWLFGPPGI